MAQNQSAVVRFLHVPKTAGTSVNAVLDRVYTSDTTFSFTGDVQGDLARLRSLSSDPRSRLRLFRGHAPRFVGEADIDSARTFTLLREPVSRVMSFCRHVAEGKSEYLASSFPAERFDLDDFLGSGCPELDNFQSRMLLGCGGYASFDLSVDDPSQLESAAIGIVNGLVFAGIQEKFDESMFLLGRSFGWSVRSPAKKLNEARQSRHLVFEDRHLARIRQLNELDTRIYRHASRVLLDSIRPHRAKFFLDRCRNRFHRYCQSLGWRITACARLRGPAA